MILRLLRLNLNVYRVRELRFKPRHLACKAATAVELPVRIGISYSYEQPPNSTNALIGRIIVTYDRFASG
jgi:hypothetical protein